MTLVRDGIRSGRSRLRWLFALSGFVVICVAMTMMPLVLGVASSVFGHAADADAARTFLNAALGLCVILLELGVIFKLYSSALDHELWYYSLVGSQPHSQTTLKCRFLKIGAMAFIVTGMILLLWGMMAPSLDVGQASAILTVGSEQHGVDLVRTMASERAHRLAELSLLMAIVSLLYFNEVKRDELRSLDSAD